MAPVPEISLPIRAPDVTRIVAIGDPIVRNLWITQSYADFAVRLRAVVGDVDLTWCGFAVWASATAGQSIRQQELPAILSRILARSDRHQASIDAVNERFRHVRRLRVLPPLTGRHVVGAFDEAIDAVSAHVAHGNTLVFAELAPLFVAFLEIVESEGRAVTTAALDGALDGAAGAPIDPGLRDAFHFYLGAASEPDLCRRARGVLAGNVLAVAHEQQRLQPDIAAAVDAGLVSAEDVMSRLVPRWVPRVVVKVLTDPVRGPIEALVRRVWEDAATELLMTLHVPGAVLRLSRTLPDLPDGRLFPADLAELGPSGDAGPYRQWDRTDGTGRHDAAHDWVVLGQRMSFIVNLFRSRQQDATLTAVPFTDAQLDVMRQGAVPPPPLLPAR